MISAQETCPRPFQTPRTPGPEDLPEAREGPWRSLSMEPGAPHVHPPPTRCGKRQIDWASSPSAGVSPHPLPGHLSVLMVHDLAPREAQVRSLCFLPTGGCCGVASHVRSSALPQVKQHLDSQHKRSKDVAVVGWRGLKRSDCFSCPSASRFVPHTCAYG